MKLEINNCKIENNELKYPENMKQSVFDLFDLCLKKFGGFIKITLSEPYRERSSGYRSQNSRLYGHCKDIADQINIDIKPNEEKYTAEKVKESIKFLAVQNRDYPILWDRIQSKMIPVSSKTSIENCQKLIDEIKQYADEHGFYLTEYSKDGKPYKSIGGYSLEEMLKYYPEINKENV